MEEQLKEQLISFETAKLAKEKGCNLENCTCGGYPECICSDKRISQSLLAKWLREKYDTDVIINTYRNQNQKYYKYFISEKSKNLIKSEEYYDTYEEAFEIGLQEALKLIK